MSDTRQSMKPTPEIAEYYNRRIRLLIQQFPGMPVFVVKLLNEVQNSSADAAQLSEQIRIDPGITTNLLRLANSARYGSVREIKSVQEAIVRLGLKRTVEILVAFHVAGHLTKPLQGYNLGTREMLSHSLWTALAAEEICRRTHVEKPEYVFTAALLHDLGKVLLSEFVFQEQPLILDLVRNSECSFDEAEKMVLGWNHCDVGAAILDHWNFPELIMQAAARHHTPDQAEEQYRMMDYAIHLADFLAYCQGPGCGIDGFSYHFCKDAKEKLSINNKELEHIASQTLEKVEDLRRALDI
jgi:putative nucleotidyltransferase with HDIG domain